MLRNEKMYNRFYIIDVLIIMHLGRLWACTMQDLFAQAIETCRD